MRNLWYLISPKLLVHFAWKTHILEPSFRGLATSPCLKPLCPRNQQKCYLLQLLVCDLALGVRKKFGRTSERKLLGREKENSRKLHCNPWDICQESFVKYLKVQKNIYERNCPTNYICKTVLYLMLLCREESDHMFQCSPSASVDLIMQF